MAMKLDDACSLLRKFKSLTVATVYGDPDPPFESREMVAKVTDELLRKLVGEEVGEDDWMKVECGMRFLELTEKQSDILGELLRPYRATKKDEKWILDEIKKMPV